MWYIMSYNTVRGTISGAFDELHDLFFKEMTFGPEGDKTMAWTSFISEAKSFEDFETAKTFIRMSWGEGIHIGVFYIPEKINEDDEQYAKDHQAQRQSFRGRLAQKQVTRQELIEIARHGSSVLEMTFNERRIIEIMRGEQ